MMEKDILRQLLECEDFEQVIEIITVNAVHLHVRLMRRNVRNG